MPFLPDNSAQQIQGELFVEQLNKVRTNYPLLHRKIREELDPSCELISDSDLVKIIRIVGTIPYRVVNRCLLKMHQRARELKSVELIQRVRVLEMQFRDGLLKLNKLQRTGRC